MFFSKPVKKRKQKVQCVVITTHEGKKLRFYGLPQVTGKTDMFAIVDIAFEKPFELPEGMSFELVPFAAIPKTAK